MEFALLLVPALDYRFGITHMPAPFSVIGNVLLVAANIVWMISKTENPYAGASIKIYEGHRLVTTGPYTIIRHPNFLGDFLMILGIPLALGSWWGLVVFALIIPALVYMIHDEERFLKENLPGYREYMTKVPRRLIPYLW
jgi:protein-S-isoprenylcysteine O-methyltransferase Ste14